MTHIYWPIECPGQVVWPDVEEVVCVLVGGEGVGAACMLVQELQSTHRHEAWNITVTYPLQNKPIKIAAVNTQTWCMKYNCYIPLAKLAHQNSCSQHTDTRHEIYSDSRRIKAHQNSCSLYPLNYTSVLM